MASLSTRRHESSISIQQDGMITLSELLPSWLTWAGKRNEKCLDAEGTISPAHIYISAPSQVLSSHPYLQSEDKNSSVR